MIPIQTNKDSNNDSKRQTITCNTEDNDEYIEASTKIYEKGMY